MTGAMARCSCITMAPVVLRGQRLSGITESETATLVGRAGRPNGAGARAPPPKRQWASSANGFVLVWATGDVARAPRTASARPIQATDRTSREPAPLRRDHGRHRSDKCLFDGSSTERSRWCLGGSRHPSCRLATVSRLNSWPMCRGSARIRSSCQSRGAVPGVGSSRFWIQPEPRVRTIAGCIRDLAGTSEAQASEFAVQNHALPDNIL